MKNIVIYDTTLRDGSQAEGVSFSLQDKLSIATKLDELGIDYIEGGYPAANPKDRSFFKEILSHPLRHAILVAFGSTRRADKKVQDDPGLQALLRAGTQTVTIVAKAWDLHVKEVLKVSFDENLKMLAESVQFFKDHGRAVFVDLEHFFQGYKNNAQYALKVLKVAEENGADTLVLCDTNGGSLPDEIEEAVKKARSHVKTPLGIHTHNDGDLAVANTLVAVRAGVRHVQGTVNGFGERCGNANLCSIIPNLVLKYGYHCLEPERLKKLTELSRYVSEVANLIPQSNQPFVGSSAFAHKAGLHVDAMRKHAATYEHITPEAVGNERRILLSELSGSSTILAKVDRYNISHDKELMRKIVDEVQERENHGYHYESAEASFEIMVKKFLGKHKDFFHLEGYRTIVERRKGNLVTEATVKIKVNGVEELTVAEGDGPVNALDAALRKALEKHYPSIKETHLVDYKVRVINSKQGTAAKVRVIIQTRDHEDLWGTVGVSENIIEASWQALVDSIEYKLFKEEERSLLTSKGSLAAVND